MTNTYAGESCNKKTARGIMFADADTALLHGLMDHGYAGGDFVTLAGPEAKEWRLLDTLHQTPLSMLQTMFDMHKKEVQDVKLLEWHTSLARKIIDNYKKFSGAATLVDVDRTGLDLALKEGFKGNVHHGRLEDFIQKSKGIRFIHLDFMGPINDNMGECFRLLGRKLLPGSIFALTFLRGREYSKDKIVKRVRGYATKFPAYSVDKSFFNTEMDHDRFIGGWEVITGWLGSNHAYTFRGGSKYHSGKSPMGMIWGQAVTKQENCKWCKPAGYQAILNNFSNVDIAQIRQASIEWDKGNLLCIDPKQKAAWKAVATREANKKLN